MKEEERILQVVIQETQQDLMRTETKDVRDAWSVQFRILSSLISVTCVENLHQY